MDIYIYTYIHIHMYLSLSISRSLALSLSLFLFPAHQYDTSRVIRRGELGKQLSATSHESRSQRGTY